MMLCWCPVGDGFLAAFLVAFFEAWGKSLERCWGCGEGGGAAIPTLDVPSISQPAIPRRVARQQLPASVSPAKMTVCARPWRAARGGAFCAPEASWDGWASLSGIWMPCGIRRLFAMRRGRRFPVSVSLFLLGAAGMGNGRLMVPSVSLLGFFHDSVVGHFA